MRLHPRTMDVQQAAAEIRGALITMQRATGLTDIEMLQAVAEWQGTHLKYMLRAERHPDDPEREADLE